MGDLAKKCNRKFCPFCQQMSSRKNAVYRCFRFDDPKYCWLMKRILIRDLIREYGYRSKV